MTLEDTRGGAILIQLGLLGRAENGANFSVINRESP